MEAVYENERGSTNGVSYEELDCSANSVTTAAMHEAKQIAKKS